jgi:hypothetical protein
MYPRLNSDHCRNWELISVTVVTIAIDKLSLEFQCSAGLVFRNTDEKLSTVPRPVSRPPTEIEREVTIFAAVPDALAWERLSPRTIILPAEAEGISKVISPEDVRAARREDLWEAYQETSGKIPVALASLQKMRYAKSQKMSLI